MPEETTLDKALKATEEQKEEKPKEKPKYTAYFPLGEGQGIRAVLWSNNLHLERRVKNEQKGEWETTEVIHLPKQVLEKLYIRLPLLFGMMKE